MLGVPFDHGHRGLDSIQQRRPLAPEQQPGQLAAERRAYGSPRVRGEQPLRGGRQRPSLDPCRGPANQLVEKAGEMGAKPRNGGELERVGRLVCRDPGQEDLLGRAELGMGGGQVRGDEHQPRWTRLADQRDLVLTQDLARGVADRDPRLGAGGGSGHGSDHRSQRPRNGQPVSDGPLQAGGELP